MKAFPVNKFNKQFSGFYPENIWIIGLIPDDDGGDTCLCIPSRFLPRPLFNIIFLKVRISNSSVYADILSIVITETNFVNTMYLTILFLEYVTGIREDGTTRIYKQIYDKSIQYVPIK